MVHKIPPGSSFFDLSRRVSTLTGYFVKQAPDWNSNTLLDGHPFDELADSDVTANLGATSTISITNLQPTVGISFAVEFARLGINLTKFQPTVSVNTQSSLPARSYSITGRVPTVSASITRTLNVGNINYTTYNPTTSISFSRTLDNTNNYTITGYNVSASTNLDVSVTLGTPSNNLLNSFNPTISSSAIAELDFTIEFPWYGNFYGYPSSTIKIESQDVTAGLRDDYNVYLDFDTEFPWYGNFYGKPVNTLTLTGYQVGYNFDNIIVPETGIITITGAAPTVDINTPIVAALNFDISYPWYGNFYGTYKTTVPIYGHAPDVGIGALVDIESDYITITGRQPGIVLSHNPIINQDTLVIAGHVPITTVGAPILAVVQTGSLYLTGQQPAVSSSVNTTTATSNITLDGKQVAVTYSLIALPTTQNISIVGYSPALGGDASVSLGNTRHYSISQLPVNSFAGARATISNSSLTINGLQVSYQFGTTAALSSPQNINITTYPVLVATTGSVTIGSSVVNITGRVPLVSATTNVHVTGHQSLIVNGYDVTNSAGIVSNLNKSNLNITTYHVNTVASDSINALLNTSQVKITGFLQSVSKSPAPAELLSGGLTITGRVPRVVVETVLDSPNQIELDSIPATATATSNAAISTGQINIIQHNVNTESNSSAEIQYQELAIHSELLNTNVVYNVAFGTTQNIALVGYNGQTSISYTREIAGDEHLTISGYETDSKLNYVSAIGTGSIIINGRTPIVDPDAKLALIGKDSLEISENIQRAGIFKRRRMVFVN